MEISYVNGGLKIPTSQFLVKAPNIVMPDIDGKEIDLSNWSWVSGGVIHFGSVIP